MASGGKDSKEQVPKLVAEKPSPRRFIRPVERQRMRPWLIEHLDKNDIPGLVWQCQRDRTFRISWKHAANQGFSMEKDTNLFERWAIHTGRHYDSDHKRWKANFRCALNSLPDVSEMKDQGIKKGSNAFKVYKFLSEKETKTVKAVFKKRREYNYKVIHVKKDEEASGSDSEFPITKEGVSDEDKDSEGDHNYAEYSLRFGHLQSGSEVRPNPSLPLLDELDSPSGVDLLLQAGSAEARCFEPLQGSPGFSSLRQILRAASDSLSSKQEKELSEESGSEVLSQHMSQLCSSSKVKLDPKQRSEEDEKSSQAYGFKCIWCEKVFATKVELFQHFLIDHQDNLIASAADSDSSTDRKPKLEKEIADLEKSVLGNYKTQTETVIEDGEVLDLSVNNELSNKDMYIEEKALDLTVKKVPRRDRDQGLLDLSKYGLGTKRSTGVGNKLKGQKSRSKRRKSTEPEEELDMSCDDDNEDDDGGGSSSGSHGDMSRQHSREDFLHAEMLLSLKSCVGSQGDGASREGSPDLDKKSTRKNNQKRKRGSKESYEAAKQSKSDEYMKNLSKIIKKVDRRVSKSGKVIVESVESEVNQDSGTVLQKQWEEQLLAVSRAKEVPGTAIQTTEEEEGMTELNVKASKKLKEVRGLTKAISKAKKGNGKHKDVYEELVISNAEDADEEMKEEKSDHSDASDEKVEHKGKKSDLQGLLDASMMSHPYKCIVCGLMYAMKDDLQAHLKTHCDYLPFKCGICGMAFEKLAFLLRNHMKIHMHNHKYVCDKCATEFSVGFQLMQHMKSHENEATAIEESADFDDSSKSAESSMAASQSNKERKAVVKKQKKYLSPFVCNLCDTTMSYGQEMSNHVKRHYKEQLATERHKNRLPKNSKKDGVDVGVETELHQGLLKQEDPVQAENRDTAKSSILAEALQSPPKYASDLVVHKAMGVMYHSSNLPAPVKDSQTLTPAGTKQEQRQVESSLLTDSKAKDVVNVPKVVHVSTSSSIGSLPILIGKGASSEGAMTQSKTDQGNASVKSQIQSIFKDSAEQSKELASDGANSQTKLEPAAGGFKSSLSGCALAQEEAKPQSSLDNINQSTVGITARSRGTQQALTHLAPKSDHPVAQRSSPEPTQFAMSQSVQGHVVQSAHNDAAPVHAKGAVNQQPKEVIIQVKQGNITQYVKVALPETLIEKTVQETSTQPVQSSMTQSTQGSTTHGTICQAKEGTFSPVVQAPIFQFVPGGSTQPSGASLVEQIQKATVETATTLKIPSQEAVAQTAQGTIAELPQGILNQTKEGVSSLLAPRAFKEEIQGDIAMPCLLQAVSVPKGTTGMNWQQASLQASQSARIGIKSAVEEAAKSYTLQSGSLLVSQGMKNCTEETKGGNSSEILPPQLPSNSSQLKLPVLAIGSDRNQGLTSTALVGDPSGQGLIASPVLGSNQQLTSNPLAYAIGPQLVRLDGNIGTLAQGKPHSTEQHGIPQLIQAVSASSVPVCSQILNLRGSSFPMSVNVPKENVHSKSQPVTLNVSFNDQGMKTTILWPDGKDGKLIPATSSILHSGGNVNLSVPSSHVVQKPGPVDQVDTSQFFIHSNNQEQNILNMVPSRSTVCPVTTTAAQAETYITTTVTNNATQTQTIPNPPNISAGSPCTTYPNLEVPKLIQESPGCLKTFGKYLQVDVEKLPEWLPTMSKSITASAGGFTISEKEVPGSSTAISKTTAQVAASTKSTGTQFSLPLIIRTSTGGGIATVQVGDKIYPLSLVFSQPLGSTQTMTSGSVSMANTVVKLPTSTVSTSTTGLSAKLSSASATTADLATNVTVSYAFPKLVSSSGSFSADSTMDVDTTPKLETKVVAQPISDAAEVTFSSTSSQQQTKSSTTAESNSTHKTASISDVGITASVNTCTSPSPSLISLRASLTSAVCTQTTKTLPGDDLKQPSSVNPDQQEGFWVCSLCSRFFSSSSALNEHISSHRSVNDHIYKCDHCEALFYDGTQMRKHNLTHFLVVNKDPNKYKCPRCDVEFSYGYQLKCHCDWIHKNHTFPCPHCDQIFVQDVALQNHLFQHPFSCHICQSRFDNRKDVEMHVTYHGVASNTCAVCQKTCKTREDMKQHLVECRKKYSIYMCESCNVLFNSQRKFTNHIQTHYSRSVVYCGICKLAFIGIEDAQNHLSVHRKSFNCVQCDQVFQDIQQMAAHMQTHENKPDCSGNDETAMNVNSKETTVEPQVTKTENASDIKEELIEDRHKFSAKNKQHRSQTRKSQRDTKGLMPEDQLLGSRSLAKAKVLKEVKVKKEDMKESDHERPQKGFICSICDVELPSRFKLKQHKVMAHYYPRTNRNISFYQHIIENIKRPKSFSCKLCNKTFDLQSTLLWHLRFHYDSNFSCRLCKIKFESKAKLIAHGKVHIFPKSVEPKRETEVTVTVKESKESDDQTEPAGTIDNDDSDDLDQSHSEDGLQIDEESESVHNIGTGSGARKVMSSVKEKLAEKCQKGRMRTAKAEASTSNQTDTSKSKKQQRKKVFGCGICKKSYFKLMKLTKHVWEHEQLQGEGQAAAIATGQDETVVMDTEESESKNKDISTEMGSDLEKQEAAVGSSSAEKESHDKSEGKYMCSLCKIKYHDSADLFKHAKVHLGQAEIAALARRKQKYAPVVTGDPSKPPVYIELDGSGNFVRRVPPKEDNSVDENKGTDSPDIEKGHELNKESA